MAILINDNYSLQACKPFDARYLNICSPWTSVSAVNTAIPTYRYTGLTVNIMGTEYWYKNGISDGDLIPKSLGGTLTGATNGLQLILSGTTVRLGGTLTGSTIITDSRTPTGRTGIEYGADYSASFVNNSLVTKLYVDTLATGLRPKAAVKVATTSTITLSGLTTIDGVPVYDGDRVLVKNQGPGVGTAIANGVYVVSSASTWTRALDFDGTPIGEVVSGAYMWVFTGNTNGGTAWVLITPDPITVNTTPLTFALFAAVSDVLAGPGIEVTMSGGTHYVALDANSLAVVNSAVTGATNGLTKYDSRNICLGGNLTSTSSIIPIGSAYLTLGTATNYLRVCTGSTAMVNLNSTRQSGVGVSNDCATISANDTFLSFPTKFGQMTMCSTTGAINICSGNFTTGCATGIDFTPSAMTISSGSALFPGVKYFANYCANFTARSLVDKGYVDFKTSGATGTITGATNGLTVTGKQIKLGGILTGNTTISGATKALSLGTSTSKLGAVNIFSNAGGMSVCTDGSFSVGAASGFATTCAFGIMMYNGANSVMSLSDTCKFLWDASRSEGYVYGSDYSACGGKNPRWLPDAAWVTGKTSALGAVITGATNGLCVTGKKVKLGGALTGNTCISAGNNSFWVTGNSSTCLVLGTVGRYIMSCPVTNLVMLGDCTYAANYIRTSSTYTTVDAGATGVLELCSPVGSFFLGCGSEAIYCGTSNTGIKYSAVTNGWITSQPKALVTNEWTTGYTQSAISCKSNTVNVYCQAIKANYTATTTSDFIGAQSGSTIYMPNPRKLCQRVIVADVSGHALDCMIVINGNGFCINGADCATVNTDYGSVTLINNGNFWSTVAFIN